MDQQYFSNSELLMPSMYRTRGQLIVWTLGPAAASRVYICTCVEWGRKLSPWVQVPLIPTALAVGVQGAWRQPWRRAVSSHSGHTTAGPGYQQSGHIVFDNTIWYTSLYIAWNAYACIHVSYSFRKINQSGVQLRALNLCPYQLTAQPSSQTDHLRKLPLIKPWWVCGPLLSKILLLTVSCLCTAETPTTVSMNLLQVAKNRLSRSHNTNNFWVVGNLKTEFFPW